MLCAQGVLRQARLLVAMVVANPTLVAAQPLGDAIERAVEGGMGVVGLAVTLDDDAAADMNRDIGADALGLAGKYDVSLDRVVEIFDHRIG